VIEREWELLSYAVAEIAVARQISEADAFEQLKAWIVDEKVHARGPWPAGPGVADPDDPVSLLPFHRFRFATRRGDRVDVDVKASPWVQINMVQVRTALRPQAAADSNGVPAKGGRPYKADWSALKEALKNEIMMVGFPHKEAEPGWRTMTDVSRWLGARLADDDDVSPRTLRDQAQRMISEIKRELGRN
jgi:hypothetical protein